MIDREKVIKGLEIIIWEVDHNSMWLPGDDDIRDAIELLKEQETVIRCKDCWRRDSFDCHLHEGGYPYHDTADDWFCGDGEREQNEKS